MGSVAPQMYRMITGIDPFELLIRTHLGDDVRIDDSVLKAAGSVVTVASRHGGRIAQGLCIQGCVRNAMVGRHDCQHGFRVTRRQQGAACQHRAGHQRAKPQAGQPRLQRRFGVVACRDENEHGTPEFIVPAADARSS